MTTTNEDLIAEARAGSMEDRAWMIDVIERLADALAAVPAEGDRDALIHLLGTQPFSASSFEDFFGRVADAILAAGYRLPRTVSTVEELEALPVGSIVRNWQDERTGYEDGTWSQGAVAEKRPDLAGQPAWFLVGSALGYRSHQADILPAAVLYVPVSPEGGERAKG